MLAKITLFLFVAATSNVVMADALGDWNTNYLNLINELEAISNVGDCSISLSKDPQYSEDSRILNLLKTGTGLMTFSMFPPKETLGRTQVDYVGETVIRYRESDIAGWVNLIIYFSEDQSIVGLQLNKSLPDGTIYSQGPNCGTTK